VSSQSSTINIYSSNQF